MLWFKSLLLKQDVAKANEYILIDDSGLFFLFLFFCCFFLYGEIHIVSVYDWSGYIQACTLTVHLG